MKIRYKHIFSLIMILMLVIGSVETVYAGWTFTDPDFFRDYVHQDYINQYGLDEGPYIIKLYEPSSSILCDTRKVKSIIKQYGGISVGYNPTRHQYAIVGWDDNFVNPNGSKGRWVVIEGNDQKLSDENGTAGMYSSNPKDLEFAFTYDADYAGEDYDTVAYYEISDTRPFSFDIQFSPAYKNNYSYTNRTDDVLKIKYAWCRIWQMRNHGYKIGVSYDPSNNDNKVYYSNNFVSRGFEDHLEEGYVDFDDGAYIYPGETVKFLGPVEHVYMDKVEHDNTLVLHDISDYSISANEAGVQMDVSYTGESPVYASSDTSVCTVSSSGYITPVKSGVTTVTVSNSERSWSRQVTVYRELKEADISGSYNTLEARDTLFRTLSKGYNVYQEGNIDITDRVDFTISKLGAPFYIGSTQVPNYGEYINTVPVTYEITFTPKEQYSDHLSGSVTKTFTVDKISFADYLNYLKTHPNDVAMGFGTGTVSVTYAENGVYSPSYPNSMVAPYGKLGGNSAVGDGVITLIPMNNNAGNVSATASITGSSTIADGEAVVGITIEPRELRPQTGASPIEGRSVRIKFK